MYVWAKRKLKERFRLVRNPYFFLFLFFSILVWNGSSYEYKTTVNLPVNL